MMWFPGKKYIKKINKAEITKTGQSSEQSVYRPALSLCGTGKRYPG